MTDLSIESCDALPGDSSEIMEESKTPVGTSPVTGFIAGILSGVTKLLIGHPFDTIKVRLQVSGDRFNNSVTNCVRTTVRKEGLRALYKGGSPPLFGWAVMDSV